MKLVFRLLIPALVAAALCGCGVVRSMSAISLAQQEYDAAKQEDALDKAPYQYTLGEEYLRKAKEELGYSDYQVAEGLAEQSKSYLEEARRKSTMADTTGASQESSLEE